VKVKFTEGGMNGDLSWYSERWVDVPDDFSERLMKAVSEEAAHPRHPDRLIVSAAFKQAYEDATNGR
jgi:hypothetical protein